ncbi:FitA-like ribbon-helix-helix domain-containing protein, partial [Escherichia coli]|uniref:FitA-like ribbon-helix-helix domain-containing protein n=1 Tax=Escherichia coli TaxID=562 RepID=UPI001BC8C0D4
IRDIPDDVAATLKARAATEGRSRSAYVGAELSKLARRPTSAELVSRLRAADRRGAPTREDILAALHEGRR